MTQQQVESLRRDHPLKTFIRRVGSDTLAAGVLVGATLAALIWANFGESYQFVWNSSASFTIAGHSLELSLAEWVNEGLMTIFFFGIGLDVRREMSLGDLRRPSQAALPILAAIGGILIPALIFISINHSGPGLNAWGAVISTDTAFALGMLALIGPRRAPRLRVFLLAAAVVDDIVALLVIAVLYTNELQVLWLIPVVVGLLLVWWMARREVWRASPFVAVGIAVWLCTYFSGVHGTLAGVLLALLLPVYPTKLDDVEVASRMSRLFQQAPRPESATRAKKSISRAVPLNQRMSGLVEPYTNYLIVPLFALSNAGVVFHASTVDAALTSTLTWGIIAGLVLGKVIGMTGASALVLRLRPGTARPGLDLTRIAGIGGLGGMGFTISLLVIDLAIDDEGVADEARIGVLAASLIALIVAWVTFVLGNRFNPLPPAEGQILPREIDPKRDHLRGSEHSPAQLVVYADMGEIYRRRTAETLAEVRTALGDQLCIVYRHNVQEEQLVLVALALESAAKQGLFWELHDTLVQHRELPRAEEFGQLAEDTGLDRERLKRDVRTFTDFSRIKNDSADAEDIGIGEDPVIFVNGKRLAGPASASFLLYLLRQKMEADGMSQE